MDDLRWRKTLLVQRRTFLRHTLGTLGVLATIPLLAACGASVPVAPATGATPGQSATLAPAAPPTGGTSSKLALPTYIPVELAKPDLPGSAAGVDPAYFTYPKTLVKSVTDTPSRGGDVTVFTRVILATPPPLEANAGLAGGQQGPRRQYEDQYGADGRLQHQAGHHYRRQ